jgi:alpha-L-arabinofuranosidase
MRLWIVDGQKAGQPVPREILGQNLELVLDGERGFTNERLSNGKFRGPESPVTGLAEGWDAYPINDLKGMRLRLQLGMGIDGKEAMVVENYSGKKGYGIAQTGILLASGERIRIALWARIQDGPVALQVGLKPLGAFCGNHGAGTILVDSPYWKRYSVVLDITASDDKAVFFCLLETIGYVCIDQISVSDDEAGIVSRAAMEALVELRPPAIRFPGGCLSTIYHWRNGTGPRHRRPSGHDPVFKHHVDYEFGTDEYLALCSELHATPHITVNISTATPEDAFEWASYCWDWFVRKEIEPPTMNWQIGNEQYGAWEIGHMTAGMYAEVLSSFAPRIRAGYPRAVLIGLGVEEGQGFAFGETHPWRQVVLNASGGLVDVLALQCYHTLGYDADKTRQMQSNDRAVESIRNGLQSILSDLDARGLGKIRAGLTEWNQWYHAAHHDGRRFHEPYDVQHVIYAARIVHLLARLSPRIGAADFYNLVNVMGVIACDGPKVERTAMFDLFRLYGDVLPGERIELAPTDDEDASAVDALCIRSGARTVFFLVNSLTDRSIPVEFAGPCPRRILARWTGRSVEGDFQMEDPVDLGDTTLTLPPLSLLCIEET